MDEAKPLTTARTPAPFAGDLDQFFNRMMKNWTYYSERSYGSFARVFALPADADRDGISAKFAKGVLTLEIAETATPPAQVKQVALKAA